MNEQSIYVSGSNYFNNDDLNNMTRLLEEGKTIEHLTRNKNDMMKDVVINYRGCGHHEYYGMLVWRDGLQYCRRCIHQIWVKENPNGWKPGPDEKYFPLYEDGVNYYEKDLKEKENE